MKKNITAATWLKKFRIPASLLLLGTVLYGCYVIKVIRQPAAGDPNSSFTVDIVLDPNPGDDYTGDNLKGFGLFGVLIPNGWTVEDNITFNVVSEQAQYTTTGTLSFNEAQGAALTAKIPPPTGYHWWGGKTKGEIDTHYFDSLYFSIKVLTDDQLGNFKLKYAFGDTENSDRVPVRSGAVSNDYPIKIGLLTAAEQTTESGFKVYPTLTDGKFMVDYTSEKPGVIRELKIFNADGQHIQSTVVNHGSNSVDISGSPKGMYFVSIENQGKRRTQRILLK
jgi:hypothetical protein